MSSVAVVQTCFAAVATSLLTLFYLVTYRTTRAPFCGWWCASLALFLGAAAAWLFTGTGVQWLAVPLGNVLSVAGAVTVWFAIRSLRRKQAAWVLLGALPALSGGAAALGDVGTNPWAGGLVFMASMALAFVLAARETWRVAVSAGEISQNYLAIVRGLAVISSAVATLYLARTVTLASLGADHPLFDSVLGTVTTTIFTTAMLVTVSYGMSLLSQEQRLQELYSRASRDDLTGLLRRREFLSLATTQLRTVNRAVLIIADLDHFKRINDQFGHASGDQVLTAFAQACRDTTRSTDLCARYGGEEFVILLPGAGPEAGRIVCQAISTALREADLLQDYWKPTASYGIATVAGPGDLTAALARADVAVYQAKAAGRDRAVIA